MRAGIGILSILIAVAIIFIVAFSGPKGGVIPAVMQGGQVGQSEAAQLAGRDENGIPAQESITFEENSPGGQFRSLTVKKILPTGPMATVYGLVPGDEILQAGSYQFRGTGDAELAKDMVFDAFGKNQPLIIVRNGQEMTVNPHSALTAAHPNYFGAPGATVNNNAAPVANPPQPSTPQGQLNQIQQQMQPVPSH